MQLIAVFISELELFDKYFKKKKVDQEKNGLEKFFSLINGVINRPAMYGVNNIEDLGLVIFGYNAAFEENELDELLFNFRTFINKEFDSNGDHDWIRLIRFYSGGDRHSLELFKDKFNSFLKQNKMNFEVGVL